MRSVARLRQLKFLKGRCLLVCVCATVRMCLHLQESRRSKGAMW